VLTSIKSSFPSSSFGEDILTDGLTHRYAIPTLNSFLCSLFKKMDMEVKLNLLIAKRISLLVKVKVSRQEDVL